MVQSQDIKGEPSPEPQVKKKTSSESAAPTIRSKKKASKKSQATGSAPRLPEALKDVEKKYAEAGTLVADFVQLNEMPAYNRKTKSTGDIAVKRPDKLRWQTLEPDPNLLVSNGKKFWFYTPPFDEEEPGQVIVRRSSDVQSELANALLAGQFSKARGMKIERKSAAHYVLTPKAGTAGTVANAEVVLDVKENLIKKVILTHRGGNRSEITLKNVELGKELPDSMFEFKPPANTTVVEE